MKKTLITIIIGLVLIFLTLVVYISKDDKKEVKENKIKVAEVTHSVFYAPWYVALENKYFDNLDIEVILTSGANNVAAAVLSGDVEIGFCGPEATIYIYKEKNQDYIKSFAGLTKRDGQFLVLRNNVKYHDFKDIEGLTILAGRSAGMPLLNFTNALKKENIKNVTIDDSVDFANLTSAFIAGQGDGVNLFEPNATKLVKEGYGFIADSIGTYSGVVPYTAFNAKKSYIEKNQDIIKTFYKGIEKGLDFVHNHTEEEIADVIIKQFPDTSRNDLITMIKNYKNADSWFKTPEITEESFKNLEDIMIDNKELETYVNFKDLIYELN